MTKRSRPARLTIEDLDAAEGGAMIATNLGRRKSLVGKESVLIQTETIPNRETFAKSRTQGESQGEAVIQTEITPMYR
ncbi:MAG: hypothetical protein AAF479_13395 [Pseudomonadota bacterium]